MTQIILLKSRQGFEGFEVRGHCGYADAGYDIVCSAVSALTQTTAMALQKLLHLQIALEIEDGEMCCILPAQTDDGIYRQAQLLFETMILGLRDIAQSYGDYINISERKV